MEAIVNLQNHFLKKTKTKSPVQEKPVGVKGRERGRVDISFCWNFFMQPKLSLFIVSCIKVVINSNKT